MTPAEYEIHYHMREIASHAECISIICDARSNEVTDEVKEVAWDVVADVSEAFSTLNPRIEKTGLSAIT